MVNCIDCSDLSIFILELVIELELVFRLADSGEGAVWHGKAGWVCVERVLSEHDT